MVESDTHTFGACGNGSSKKGAWLQGSAHSMAHAATRGDGGERSWHPSSQAAHFIHVLWPHASTGAVLQQRIDKRAATC